MKPKLGLTSPRPLAKNMKTYVRGMGFKFVDFLHKSSDICNREIKIRSSKNTIIHLSYEILNILLLNMDAVQHRMKHNDPP